MNTNYNCIQILKLIKTNLEDNIEWGEENVYGDMNIVQNQDSMLTELKQKISKCRKCNLGNERINIVFGVGNSNASLMLIGEAPGYEEDHQGEPFVGKAGQLLTKIINAIGYNRQDIYITNIVKCHPMKNIINCNKRDNNRPPTIYEINHCMQYLEKQIDIIKPKIIVTLGSSATKGLLNIDVNISIVRGTIMKYKNIIVIPTYHPAALLRNNNLKKYVWADMKQIRKYLLL
ncbi:MAG: uracil-DNA glycosylase [Endomicrobium sp.]|jgi:DNA polymerase|nr:uracil-DNA glycosylase [Endomicrobium sp.]